MAKSFDELKEILLKEKEKYEFEQTVRKVYSRPKLTKQVKKASAHAPGRLDCFKDENRAYSDKEVRTYLDGTSYFETYNAMRGQDNYE
jgi:hypothetical protein